MTDTNENEKKNKSVRLSPLKSDEINSVIKSFQEISFNKEKLYAQKNNAFLKKTLFELAKDSENKSQLKSNQTSNENEKKTNSHLLDKETVGENESNFDKSDESKLENSVDKNLDVKTNGDVYENNIENKDNDELLETNKNIDIQSQASEDELIKINEQKEKEIEEQKIKSKFIDDMSPNDQNKLEQEENLENLSNVNDIKKDDKTKENNYEDKTLNALDSVREAVTKSLDKNLEIKNEKLSGKAADENLQDVKIKLDENIISELTNLDALFKNIREISNQKIEDVVKSKVVQLTEDLVGYQIEKFPDKYLKKIKDTVGELKNLNDNIKIILSPEDKRVFENFLKEKRFDFTFNLDADINLGRGDFTIDSGGLMHSIKYQKTVE